jgi:hypothetical protein
MFLMVAQFAAVTDRVAALQVGGQRSRFVVQVSNDICNDAVQAFRPPGPWVVIAVACAPGWCGIGCCKCFCNVRCQ